MLSVFSTTSIDDEAESRRLGTAPLEIVMS
jgi:hypothetical protein